MKIGSLVYATDQGLGILAKAFYDHGVVTDVMVVRHGRHPTHDEWYPDAEQCNNIHGLMARFPDWCRRVKPDVMLFFETPFDWSAVSWCRERGIKTVVMPMHECMPERIPAQPDLWLCPSLLDVDWADRLQPTSARCFLPVPVVVPWRLRTKAEVFVHNAGHGGLRGRNGTKELVDAIHLVKSPAQFVIRAQSHFEEIVHDLRGDERVFVATGTVPYDELMASGDVFVFPEKFNGLSLPLNEARAAGMLVMATDRYPMNTWLPQTAVSSRHVVDDDIDVVGYSKVLIPTSGSVRSRIGPPYSEFNEAVIDPRAIAERIDEWYGRDISEYSLSGKKWAEENSWEALKPKYLEVLEAM